MAKVVIGVDPHKWINAVVVLNTKGKVLGRAQFDNSAGGFRQLRAFSRQWRPRTWAVEGCNGVGKHLAQRLVAEGERVVDVSTRRVALVRVYAGGNGRKNDDTEAHSIALVALHTPDLVEVRPDDRTVAMRLLANRRHELVGLRTQAVCRIHRDLVNLLPGGAPRALTAAKAKQLLAKVRPRDEVGRLRRRLIAEQITDLGAIDRRLHEVGVEIKAAIAETPTGLTRLCGVGPVTTAGVLDEVGDVARFRSRHHFASYTGTAPVDSSSGGGPLAYRLNTKGNRKLNHAIHMVAVTQVRNDCAGRAFPAQAGGGEDAQRGATGAQAPDLRRDLPPAARGRRRSAGPGRASGDDSYDQRGRLNPDGRLFGKATARAPSRN